MEKKTNQIDQFHNKKDYSKINNQINQSVVVEQGQIPLL